MDEMLCLLACKYAIMEIVSKGSVAFTTIVDGKRCRIDWLSVVDYIDGKLEKIEETGED